MPGLTIWIPAAGEQDVAARFRRAQRLMIRSPADEAVVDIERPTCVIGHVGHRGYPVQTWIEKGPAVLLEGHIYDRSDDQVKRDLQTLFRRAFSGPDAIGAVTDFVGATDGDFLAVGVSEDGGQALVFSDALGRLPTYLHVGSEGVILARECKFLASIRQHWEFDRMGLAQQLWLGYPLGERTLFEGIERTGEGFVIRTLSAHGEVVSKREVGYSYRCDEKPDRRGVKASAEDLAAKIAIAARGRANSAGDATTLVSLSGGNDSRTVLAGLETGRRNVVAATFQRNDGGQAADVRVAKLVAEALGVEWHAIALPATRTEAAGELAWRKDGLNSVTMAFLLPFFEEVAERWGERLVLMTGDGGDKIFPDLRPLRRPRSIEQLATAVIDDAMVTPAHVVEPAFGLAPGSLRSELTARLAAYPEPTLEHKAVRFLIAERGRKALFEGEDRGRSYVWQVTPFYALPVFAAALAVPDKEKPDYRFYAEVQRHLNPKLLAIPHADFGMSIDSPRFRRRARARRWVLQGAGPVVRPVLARLRGPGRELPGPRQEALALFDAAVSTHSALARTLEPALALEMLSNLPPTGLDLWRTIALVDQLWGERLS